LLELFLALIDRVIALAKTRSEDRERWLAVITPLHQQLITVHADYLSFFTQARTDLRNGVAVRAVLDSLIERRLRLEPLRHSLRAMESVRAQDSSEWSKGRTWFFMALGQYLRSADEGSGAGSVASPLINVVERMLRRGLSEPELRRDFELMLSETLETLRTRFDSVAVAYATLQKEAL